MVKLNDDSMSKVSKKTIILICDDENKNQELIKEQYNTLLEYSRLYIKKIQRSTRWQLF